MKQFFFLFLLLNIYSFSCTLLYSQSLYLEISGKDSTQTSVISGLNYTKQFNNFSTLEAEVNTSERRLEKKGYVALERISFRKENDSLYKAIFDLKELFKEIRIYYPQNILDFNFLKMDIHHLSKKNTDLYFVLDFSEIEEALNHLNSSLADSGDPFASLQLVDIAPSSYESNTLEASLEIKSTKPRTITGIEIRGYEKFRRPFLRYTTGIREGILFQREKLIKQNELINNLGFVSTIKAPEILFTEDETIVYLYLEKINNNLFDGIIGFATNEDTGKLEFNGYLNLALNNNLDYGEKFVLNYKNDGNDQQLFQVNAELPFILKSPVGVEMGLQFFKRDTTFLTVEKHLLANYQFNTRTRVFAGYKDYESTNLLDETPAGMDIQDYTSRFAVVGAQYLRFQNNKLFREKTTARITSEFGARDSKTIKTPQFKAKLDLSHIFQLNLNNSIFVRNETGFIYSDDLFVNELLRFGGINSIRGFDENSIDASLFSVLNTEYRYQLSSDTYIHSIIDYAYFENNITKATNQLYSFGGGLGIQTQTGIFKLNLANGKLQGQEFRFSNTKIHVSLTSIF